MDIKFPWGRLWGIATTTLLSWGDRPPPHLPYGIGAYCAVKVGWALCQKRHWSENVYFVEVCRQRTKRETLQRDPL